MAELVLALFFIAVLVAFDAERYAAMRDRLAELADQLDKPE